MARTAAWVAVTIVGLALAAGAAWPAEAYHDATVHAELRAWFATLDAEVQSSRGGVVGDVITEDDLDLDNRTVPGGELLLRLARRHTIRVEGFAFSAEGNTRIDRTFSFAGRTYTVNSGVLSDFDARVIGADYGFDVIHAGPIALGLTLGLRALDVDARLDAPDLGFASEVSLQALVPAVGAVLILHPVPVPPLASLALTLRLSGLSIGDRGEFFDVDAGAEWLPLPFLALRVGYRLVHGKGKEGGDRARFDVGGPHASLTLAF